MSEYLYRRGSRFYFRRRVPRELAAYDVRPEIKIALKTTSVTEASRLATVYNDYIEAFWRDLVAKGKRYEESEYARAVSLARAHGFTYKSAADIVRAPRHEILERIDVVAHHADDINGISNAMLGGVERPALLLSDCLDRYWPAAQDKTAGKSPNQIRKWKNPRQLAFDTFVQAVGDRPLATLERRDLLRYRAWWQERAGNDYSPNTANKHISYIKGILRTVTLIEEIDLDVTTLFSDLRLKGKKTSRSAYDAAFIQNSILAVGVLDGLNEDARWLVHAMADTGARINELTGLRPQDIILDAKIPHIHIRAYNEHALKSTQSERQIPLVGSALKAFRAMPQGFVRYDNADSVSNLVNKYLSTHGLRPTEKHSLYSLRHCFKDRLRDAGAPEEIIDELMGHEGHRPKYGRGHLLEAKLKWMKKIAFKG